MNKTSIIPDTAVPPTRDIPSGRYTREWIEQEADELYWETFHWYDAALGGESAGKIAGAVSRALRETLKTEMNR